MLKNGHSTLRRGDWVGKYKIDGTIGKGGMGDIYRAVQEPLGRVVALKVLLPHMQDDEEFAARFAVEAEAVSHLEHQNVINIFDYGEENGCRYIAMQYIDGMDLGRYISETKVMPVAEIINISKQICRGLRYAHNRSILHRDIKPQNILLDKSKNVYITDFGIAKLPSQNLTGIGLTVGTPEYMSPEQAQGKKDIDILTDIYSLGIVMYEMLTRKPPFTGNNPLAIAHMQVNEQPPPPSQKRKDVPKMLEMIIVKALKKDRRERYQSVEELLEDLDRVDPAETAPRKTVRLPTPKEIEDRRIRVDRRGKDRRYDSGGYWAEMARTQWLSWIAIGALAAAFILHVVKS
jgi:serine/threonine protein kinase